jgi:hypothetical protein
MKRYFLLGLLILTAVVFTYGQNASPIDLVLLLDTSTAMSSSYDNVNNYVTGDFLNEFLRVGDTFHLIAFSANPKLDVARRILGTGDVETIIGRMLLQYPVENASNISSALTFAEQYITTLPARPKKIVLVTTGGSNTDTLVTASKQRLNSRNATLDYIQITPGRPVSNTPKSGRPAAVTTTTTTRTTTQSSTGGRSSGTTAQTSTGSGTSAGTTSGAGGTTGTSTGTTSGGTGASSDSQGQGFADGSTNSTGQQPGTSGTTDDYSSDNKDAKPYISAEERARNRSESFSSSLPFILFVIILILLILGLIIFLASRRLGSSPNRVMAEVASSSSKNRTRDEKEVSRFADHSKDLAKYASVQSRRSNPYEDRHLKTENYRPPVINSSGPLLLNLFVEDQNTAIGKRNIHSLKSGYGLSVGGGKADDYLIFLVPIPPHIGEIRRDGSSLTFIPKKPKYFPDIGANEIKDCINKTIRIISDKHYEMRFRFEMYEDPLIALNRILMSVKIPG